MRFRHALLIGILSAALLPFALLSAWQVRSIAQESERDDARQWSAAQSAARALGREVGNAGRLVRAAALSAEAALAERATPALVKTLQAAVKELAEASPLIVNLHIDDASMRSLVFWPPVNEAGETNWNQDHSQRWHASAIRRPAGSLMSSSAFVATGAYRDATVGIAAPIAGRGERAGRNVGVASAVLDLEQVGAVARRIERQAGLPGLSIVVLDRDGRVLHPRAEDAGGWTTVEAADLESALRAQPEALAETTLPSALLRPEDARGGTVLQVSAAAQPVAESGGLALGWRVLALRPASVRHAELHAAILRSAAAGGAILLLLLAAAGLLSGALSSAAERLVRHVAAGRPKPDPHDRVRFPKELAIVQEAYGRALEEAEAKSRALARLNAELEEKVAERTRDLARQTETLSHLFEAMAEGFVVTAQGSNGLEVRLSNRRAKALLGGAARAGTPVAELLAALGVEALPASGAAATLRARPEDGRRLEALRFPLEDGRGFGLLLRDVTEREAQADMKSAMIGMVAHELKTPIAAIRLEVEALRGTGAGDPEALSELGESAEHLQRLVDDWLDAARIEGGAFRIERKPLQLALAARRAAKRARRRFPALEVEFDFAEDAQMLVGDEARLGQLFENLFTNAARYAKPGVGPKASVSARRTAAGAIEIRVADNGVGIVPAEAEAVFEKFRQGGRAKRRSGGTGLGLFIARAVALSHGGSIRAEPLDPSDFRAGTVFVVVLPEIAPEAETPGPRLA